MFKIMYSFAVLNIILTIMFELSAKLGYSMYKKICIYGANQFYKFRPIS